MPCTMKFSLLASIVIGVSLAECAGAAALLLWAGSQYAVGLSHGFWHGQALLLALIGATLGAAVYLLNRGTSRR